VGVFALILPLAARGAAGLAGGVGLYIAIYSIGCIVVVLLLYPAASIFGGVPIRQFARAALPGQLIAFSTSSSIAALPGLVEGADRDLKVDSSVSGFVLPLAVSVFKPAAPVTWTVGSLFVARFYGIPLHAPEFAIIAFASVFLVFISPGIPRGGFLVLAPLFLAIGLPVEGIGILIAVDAIPDIFATLLNATGDLLATVLVARAMRPTPA
jgi:proton glutamate symport protein